MAQSTVDDRTIDHRTVDHRTVDHRTSTAERGLSRAEHLREVLPALLAVALLLGVVVAGGLVLRDLLDFGVWFLSGWE